MLTRTWGLAKSFIQIPRSLLMSKIYGSYQELVFEGYAHWKITTPHMNPGSWHPDHSHKYFLIP